MELMLRFLGLRYWEMPEPSSGWPLTIHWLLEQYPGGKFYFSPHSGVSYISTGRILDNLDHYHALITEEMVKKVTAMCVVRAFRLKKRSQIPHFPMLIDKLYQFNLSLPIKI
jgi:hypothetical protein